MEGYDPATTTVPHKASSITSTTSNSSWDNPPSLYSGSSVHEDAESPYIHETLPDEDFHPKIANWDHCSLIKDKDQKQISDFLDSFFIESTMPKQQKRDTTHAAHSEMVATTTTMEDETSPIYLCQSHQVAVPISSSCLVRKRTSQGMPTKPSHPRYEPEPGDVMATSPVPASNSKSHHQAPKQRRVTRNRDILTDDERRANHIASEQKRRNSIRNGFKEMTDIIPTLKNINNSKSTILFKAVDYIRHLEKRNRGLREKLRSLQMRHEVEKRMIRNNNVNWFQRRCLAQDSLQVHASPTMANNEGLHPSAMAALMAHKNQQNQLQLLQQQLRVQQELLTKHNIKPTSSAAPIYHSISIPMSHVNNSPTQLPPLMPTSKEKWMANALNAPSLNIPADDEYPKEAYRDH
ncbi:uncharacterized protein BYT42DRAFT_575476 [Radiomyces spectabilis]|uniref:uncharacterized protein n=1 Tax=Radiomyces spectabilis TaxID=64574 RepID=UPI00221F7C0A|nr:uncharacterized protein BYT42DRAFT_575476 [Radiomyces spectabilis]KAI8374214.1 hypothetical protein BYT42DRAFT_575476 [Radiomyces spectabilis]